MKRKILWCWLSLLLVAALVLASCGPKEEVVVEKGEMYGGTITVIVQPRWPMQSCDVADLQWQVNYSRSPSFESLIHGDIEKYGPRGTNEFAFVSDYVPDAYLTGHVAESWEVSPERIVFHIRPGIMWAACPIMESREVTAADVAHSLNRWLEAARIKRPATCEFVDDIYAEGNTVIVETNRFDPGWSVNIAHGRYTHLQPPELVKAGAADWRNHIGVGNGPFLLGDYDVDTLITYVKNPNYWNTTTVDGVEYSIPFADTLRHPIIPDESTQVAAVRTGKIDWAYRLSLVFEDTLRQTSPDLLLVKRPGSHLCFVKIRTDYEPFSDVNVRRALMIGMDSEPIMDATYHGGYIHAFPMIPGGPVYTPLDELPASAQELYEYDPVKAKKMLADAGYPDGFEMTIISDPLPSYSEQAEMLMAQWGEIGVKVTTRILESAAFSAATGYPADFHDAFMGTEPRTDPYWAFPATFMEGNPMRWTDEYAEEQYAAVLAEPDPAERDAMLKELGVYLLEQVPLIAIGSRIEMAAWWPWVKNYYGETASGYAHSQLQIFATMWIDEDLKAELGY